MTNNFEHEQIFNLDQFEIHCDCGCDVQQIDGDCAKIDIGHSVRGVGWNILVWDCPECGRVYSLCLGVVSNPIDDIIAIDNTQESQLSRAVLLEMNGIKILGIEEFGVKHQNPVAGFALRQYDYMAEYYIGPMKDTKRLYQETRSVASDLINRIQIEFPKQNLTDGFPMAPNSKP